MNLFTWIRDGVKRAVLSGVSDAVEHIGSPSETDEAGQRFLALLRDPPRIDVRSAEPQPQARKRLGRSLEQIANSASPATP
jgi:hypothetical protein